VLSGLECDLMAWVRQLSAAESHYTVAHDSLGELLDASQASIIRAQDQLRSFDPAAQGALKMMIYYADRLHHTANHFQRQSRDLASVGGILRLLSQTVVAMRQRDPMTLAIPASIPDGRDEAAAPAEMATRLNRLRLQAEQLALAPKSVSLSQVREVMLQLRAAMEALLKPTAEDFAELAAWLVEIQKHHLIVRQHLIEE